MFGRPFFETTFPQIVWEYYTHRKLSAVIVQVKAVGAEFWTTGFRIIGDEGAVFFTEDDRMVFVPFPSIVNVEVRTPTGQHIGFQPTRPADV